MKNANVNLSSTQCRRNMGIINISVTVLWENDMRKLFYSFYSFQFWKRCLNELRLNSVCATVLSSGVIFKAFFACFVMILIPVTIRYVYLQLFVSAMLVFPASGHGLDATCSPDLDHITSQSKLPHFIKFDKRDRMKAFSGDLAENKKQFLLLQLFHKASKLQMGS